MSESQSSTGNGSERLLIALFDQESSAEKAVGTLVERDFPMDMLSVLGKGNASGDDPLGLYYPGVGERMKGWGAMGAFWGGLWGLLAGAAGMFFIPGLGPILAAGPIVEALAGALGVDVDPEALKIGDAVRLEFRRVRQAGASGILCYGYKFVPVRH